MTGHLFRFSGASCGRGLSASANADVTSRPRRDPPKWTNPDCDPHPSGLVGDEQLLASGLSGFTAHSRRDDAPSLYAKRLECGATAPLSIGCRLSERREKPESHTRAEENARSKDGRGPYTFSFELVSALAAIRLGS
jgi:hypothetical protein